MDISRFEDEDEDGREHGGTTENEPDSDLEDANARFQAILLRSKKRQEEFTGRASAFEAIIEESALERKDHWRQVKKTVC